MSLAGSIPFGPQLRFGTWYVVWVPRSSSVLQDGRWPTIYGFRAPIVGDLLMPLPVKICRAVTRWHLARCICDLEHKCSVNSILNATWSELRSHGKVNFHLYLFTKWENKQSTFQNLHLPCTLQFRWRKFLSFRAEGTELKLVGSDLYH